MSKKELSTECGSGEKHMTMAGIARLVGVSRAAVSAVLNPSYKTIKVSQETRERIERAIAEHHYFPSAAGQSLKYKRTGHIGFILADTVADGWANAYYGKILNGVESACRRRGYGLNVSRYNLSNLDSFVFPKHVGQRSVDGLVLVTGPIQAAVVQRFREFDIPCVCVGDDIEVAELIPTFSANIPRILFQAIAHAQSVGYDRIAYCFRGSQRATEACAEVMSLVQASDLAGRVAITLMETPGEADYSAGEPLVQRWLDMTESTRPNCLLANDQMLVAIVKSLTRRGIICPRDVGLISTVNSSLCEFCHPSLTALHIDLEQIGDETTQLLLDHLENGAELSPTRSRKDFGAEIVIRESCA